MLSRAIFGKPKAENTYSNYIERYKIDISQVMECPICMMDYKPNQKVVGLACSKLHMYHEECLESQIKARDHKCAMCRARITPL